MPPGFEEILAGVADLSVQEGKEKLGRESLDGVARDLAASWRVNAENERQKARREEANATQLTLTIEKQRTELSLLAIKQMKLPGWTVARWERKTIAMKRALWQVANAKLYNIIYKCLDTGDGKDEGKMMTSMIDADDNADDNAEERMRYGGLPGMKPEAKCG